MVDFPEGYGFEPGGKAKLMQESFKVDIGVYSRKANGWVKADRNRSPYQFIPIGYVRKENKEMPLWGILYNVGLGVGPPIEGTPQQVVTALCTLHRMKGHMK